MIVCICSLSVIQPHLPQNGSIPRSMPFKVSSIPSQPPHNTIQSDDLMRPPGTPDTPHGENHPMNEQEFGGSGSVYGPIGPNMTSNSSGASSASVGSGSLLSRSISGSHGVGVSYTNSPLSPHLPHPAPPPNMKVHSSSEIWMPHFGSNPRMTGPPHPISQVAPPHHGQSFAVGPPPSFPTQMTSLQQQQQHNHIHHHHHHQQAPSYPHVINPGGHKHLPEAPHLISRMAVGGGDHQHISDGGMFVNPNVGVRHGYGSDDYRMGNGNRIGAVHKRWSVPSYSHVPQPVSSQYSTHQVQQRELPHAPQPTLHGGGIGGGGVWSKPGHSSLPVMETRSMESVINGQPSAFEPHLSNNMYGSQGVGGGSLLSLSDPWGSRWSASSGNPGFPNPPLTQSNGPVHHAGGGRGEGSMKVSVGGSDSSWTPAPPGPGSSEEELEVNASPSESDGVTELYKLMKSLDINYEHIQSLKVG